MTNKANWILLLLLTLLLALQVRTAAVQPQTSDFVLPTEVLIRNSSNQQITFWLRNGNSKWVQFQLEPGANRPYKNVDQIWISTIGHEPAHYKLELKQRYKIVWSGTKWEVNKIAIRR